jgi:predicted acetyltransferase
MENNDEFANFEYLKGYDHIVGNDGIDLKINQYYTMPIPNLTKRVPQYEYHIVLHDSPSTIVGWINLRMKPKDYHEGLFYGGLIGYRVNEDCRGNHYARKACYVIKNLALAHNMDTVTITCDPGNHGSRKTIESLGATFLETLELPEHTELYIEGERLCSRYEWKLR